MRRSSAPALAIAMVLTLAPSIQAQRWSPDGEWIAYVVSDTELSNVSYASQIRWLMGYPMMPAVANDLPAEEVLWATHLTSGESVALDRGAFGLSEPAWSRDGSARMVHGRLRLDGDEPPRLELVAEPGVDGPTVLGRWPWTRADRHLDDESREAVTWSADGRWITAPRPEGEGLIVVEARTGRVAQRIEGATRPAWSPEGSKLAFVQAGPSPRLMMLIAGREPELLELGVLSASRDVRLPAPVWSDDGELVRVLAAAGADGDSPSLRIEGFRVNPAGPEPPTHLSEPAAPAGRRLRAADMAFLPDGSDVLFVRETPGQPNLMTWMRGKRGEVYKRFHPFLEGVPIGSLRFCPRPGDLSLAIRLGDQPRALPPAVCDPSTETLRLLAPDAACAAAWRDLIRTGLGSVLEGLDQPVPGVREASGVAGPTRLPLPGRFDAEEPGVKRLKRLARLGEALGSANGATTRLEPLSGAEASDGPSPVDRLIYGVLLARKDEVEASLVEVSGLAEDAETRERLLGLRAQLAISEGRKDQAAGIIGFLEAEATDVGWLVEEHGTGAPRVVGPLRMESTWIEGLRQSLSGRLRSDDPAAGDEPIAGLGVIEELQRGFEGLRGFEAEIEDEIPRPPTPLGPGR